MADRKTDSIQFANDLTKIVTELKSITEMIHSSQVQSQTILPTGNVVQNQLLITAFRGDKLDLTFERYGDAGIS